MGCAAEQPSLLFVFRRFHAVCWAVCFVGGFGLEGFGIMPHRHGRLFGSMYSTVFFPLIKNGWLAPFVREPLFTRGFLGVSGCSKARAEERKNEKGRRRAEQKQNRQRESRGIEKNTRSHARILTHCMGDSQFSLSFDCGLTAGLTVVTLQLLRWLKPSHFLEES